MMIDQSEAAKYGITYFGRKGFAIYENGYLVQVFNKYATPDENYRDALAWAREREEWQKLPVKQASEVAS